MLKCLEKTQAVSRKYFIFASLKIYSAKYIFWQNFYCLESDRCSLGDWYLFTVVKSKKTLWITKSDYLIGNSTHEGDPYVFYPPKNLNIEDLIYVMGRFCYVYGVQKALIN